MDISFSRHLFIAGTGRAGTSFLVRYLTALGMDTTLSRRGEQGNWSEEAAAGLEESPHALFGPNVPYVVKSPWLHLVIDELLTSARDRIDGVIVPVRDLSQAARSRIAVERRAMVRKAPWLLGLEEQWNLWAATDGGIVYSVEELDQARVLAVGFHNLIERLVAADLPVVFLHFPRLASDADYVFDKLRRYLPSDVTVDRAQEAFERVADISRVHEF